ncbi:hypothetical protein ABN214_15095 [Proteus terrae]|uniref:hypothetical protein n=1 Tax=Proteus terrae TaxID=1574161 RepID=UPI0032D9AD85
MSAESTNSETNDLLEFLELFPPAIKNNTKILGNGVDLNYTFHISTNPKIKLFTPSISQRTMNKEDRSVPRISTAKTLNGCIGGYVALLYDFEAMDDKDWNGGWKIYALPYVHALQPNKNILGDAEQTEEVWLVGYNKSHRTYPALIAGEMFVMSMAIVVDPDVKYHRKTVVTMYVRVADGYQLPLNKQVVLRSGYYHLTYNDYYTAVDVRNPQDIIVRPVSAGEYNTKKKIGSANLSYQ